MKLWSPSAQRAIAGSISAVACASIFFATSAIQVSAANAQVSAANANAQARVQYAVRRVLGGARTSARSMLAMLVDARDVLTRQLPEGSALFSADFEVFARGAKDRTATLFRNLALNCGELKIAADEDAGTYVRRASQCLTDAVASTKAAAAVYRVRYLVRQLSFVATKGSAALRKALPDIAKYMPAGIAESELLPTELKTSLASVDDNAARVFGQRATGCAALRVTQGETGLDFTKRLSDCMTKANVGGKKRDPEDVVIGRSIDRLIDVAMKGVSSLRQGVEQAIGILDERINASVLYSTSLRSALADASPLVATYFIRGARRCRRIVHSPNQPISVYAQTMGACLTESVDEVNPFRLVPVVLGAVKTLIEGAARGPASARLALAAADKQLHGKVSPGEVFGGDVRRNVALGNAAWVKQFASLGATCQVREFKKNHRFDEFVIRVNLCLSSASSGLTAERLKARILQSIASVVRTARLGARALRAMVASEVNALERVMRVTDLYPDPWRVSMRELTDASAKAFSKVGESCARIGQGKDEGLGQYVKRLAACLETSRMQSGGDAIARKIRESVQSLIDAAHTSSGTLRNSVGPAVALLGGFIDPSYLFTNPLREALAVASDSMAATFAREGRKCIEIERTGAATYFAQAVSNCLQGITRGSLDKARQDAVRDAITQIVSLADGGSQQLLQGYPPLWGKIQTHLNLGGTFVQSLFFDARVRSFASYVRGRCLSMPAETPSQVGAVRTCLFQAKATADAIQPPDACRGRTSTNLAECCLDGDNRLLRSCASYRYSCRTGQTFQNGRCVFASTAPGSTSSSGTSAAVNTTCPPGSSASSTGVCIAVPCPMGTARGLNGQCVTCPLGATMDQVGRCVQTTCPTGTALNTFGQCASGNCPVGTYFTGYGCMATVCAYGAIKDMYGRCQVVVCPDGQVMNNYRQCVAAPMGPASLPTSACPVGWAMGVQGVCVRNFCPPGTVLNAYGQCIQGACPYGYAMNAYGQCVR